MLRSFFFYPIAALALRCEHRLSGVTNLKGRENTKIYTYQRYVFSRYSVVHFAKRANKRFSNYFSRPSLRSLLRFLSFFTTRSHSLILRHCFHHANFLQLFLTLEQNFRKGDPSMDFGVTALDLNKVDQSFSFVYQCKKYLFFRHHLELT